MITVKAYSKVNLSLGITGKRADGYHTLCSVMQSVSLCDTITLSLAKAQSFGINLTCSDGTICGENNLAFLAAKRYFEVTGINAVADINIEKAIPLAGGLGGGSADAAAVLGALNFYFDKELCERKMNEIALSLGADVPFCLNGGTALAEGIGEQLTSLKHLPDCFMLIAKKGFKGSTGEMYKILDNTKCLKTPDHSIVLQGLNEGDIKKASKGFYNCFETVCSDEALYIKNEMKQKGAIYSGLSGAGPSVIGIFETKDRQIATYDSLKAIGAQVFMCEPKKVGWEILK